VVKEIVGTALIKDFNVVSSINSTNDILEELIDVKYMTFVALLVP
jgi:hypothetical protein